MTEVLLNVVGILALAGLILLSIGLHELGHLTAAKRFGVKVTEFMVGFGPRLGGFRRGETEYGVKAIPMGGYVRIVGMYPPAGENQEQRSPGRFSHLVEQAREDSLSGLGPGDEDRVFYRLPVHKRIIVMLAGPVTNLVLAVLFFTLVLTVVGRPSPTNTLQTVIDCVPTAGAPTGELGPDGECADGSTRTAASEAGLTAGSTLVAVDDHPVESWDDVGPALDATTGQTALVLERADGTRVTEQVFLTAVPYPVFESGEPTGQTRDRVFLGVSPAIETRTEPITAVPAFMGDITARSLSALVGLPVRLYELGVTLATNGERDPEGPVSVVGVGRAGGEIAAAQIPTTNKVAGILFLAGSLNLFLFLFNLLPVLPLDGGHVAAALYEALRRRWARWRGRADPGVVDTAGLLPFTYVVAVVLIGVGAMVIAADLFKPISLT